MSTTILQQGTRHEQRQAAEAGKGAHMVAGKNWLWRILSASALLSVPGLETVALDSLWASSQVPEEKSAA